MLCIGRTARGVHPQGSVALPRRILVADPDRTRTDSGLSTPCGGLRKGRHGRRGYHTDGVGVSCTSMQSLSTATPAGLAGGGVERLGGRGDCAAGPSGRPLGRPVGMLVTFTGEVLCTSSNCSGELASRFGHKAWFDNTWQWSARARGEPYGGFLEKAACFHGSRDDLHWTSLYGYANTRCPCMETSHAPCGNRSSWSNGYDSHCYSCPNGYEVTKFTTAESAPFADVGCSRSRPAWEPPSPPSPPPLAPSPLTEHRACTSASTAPRTLVRPSATLLTPGTPCRHPSRISLRPRPRPATDT